MEPTLLVADDDDSLRELTVLLLEEEGYRVLAARDGEEALQLVKAAHPDGVLLDMMMPEVDGLQFLDRLRRECAGRLPVIIAYSGFDRLEELARTHGAAAFLKKPIDPRHLLDALAILLGKRTISLDAAAERDESHRKSVAEADLRREDILQRAHLGNPALRAQLRQLVAWLTGYFSAEVAVVGLVYSDRIWVLARSGTDEFGEDVSLDLNVSYCPDVARAATPLIVRETGPGAPFANHPAAATRLRFYAGAPLIADGISVGTLCLRSSRPFLVHAEDMAVLGDFARVVGRCIRDRVVQPPALFHSEGVLVLNRFPILVESALLRAERDQSVVALATIEAEGVEQHGPAILEEAGPRYFALASLRPSRAAILAEGRAPAEAQARIAAGLSAIAAHSAVRSAVTLYPADLERPVDAGQFLHAALSAPLTAISAGVPEGAR